MSEFGAKIFDLPSMPLRVKNWHNLCQKMLQIVDFDWPKSKINVCYNLPRAVAKVLKIDVKY